MNFNENEISESQKGLLKQFRLNLADVLTPDHTDGELLKWLRVRDFNLKKAEENFRQMDANRKTFEIDTIVDTYQKPEVFEKYERTFFLGFSKEGSLVRYISMATDFYGFLMSTTAYDICLYISYMIEKDMRRTKEENIKTGRDISGNTYIWDMEGFQYEIMLHKCAIQVGLDYLRLVQEHFPEFARYMFVVNAPPMFETIYKIFKPIFRETLRKKIFVASPESTGELLKKYIDADILPAFLGGNRFDSSGDPYGREFVKYDKIRIPERYYLRNCKHKLTSTDTGVETAHIAARSVYNATLVIKKAGTKIKLEFRTDEDSIFFVLLYRPFGNDPENLDIPASDEHLDPHDKRCNVTPATCRLMVLSHIGTCSGTSLAYRPGIYIYQFDNTNSWFRSRTLYYRITEMDSEA